MTTFLIPFFAFVAVMLIMLLLYWVWFHFFDRRNKAKKQRLQAIQNVVHSGGHSLSSVKESALETWLRSNSKTFKKLEKLVQRAHSPLSAGRLMGLMLALFTLVVVWGLLHQTNPLLLLVLAAAISCTPVLWLSQKANKRSQIFGDKLPETLDYISRAMRAGHGLTAALGMVSKEFPDPIGHEFKTVFHEISFGIPFKDAVSQLGDRVQNTDLNFFVISVLIQHETGGNLTEVLDELARTVRERVKLRGKIRTLSSEGRSSAWILGSMPFAFAGIITLINPHYMTPLWTTPQGHNLILIGAGLMAIGSFLLNRISQIKV